MKKSMSQNQLEDGPSAAFVGVPRNRVSDLRVMLILSALMSFASISTDLYLPAMPIMQKALSGSGSVAWTISGFLIGFSLGQLVWGPISDRHGRKWPLALGMMLFIVGSAGCALSTTVWQMVIWRVVQALGASVGPVLSRAMVRDLYDREQGAHMLSTLIMIMGLAPLVGPLLGGQILRLWDWSGIFWSLTGVGLATLVAIRSLPESFPASQRLTTPLNRAFSDYLGLLSDRRLARYILAGGFFYAGAYAFIAGSPAAYIDAYGVSPQVYGFLFGVNIIGIIGANYLNRGLIRIFGSERLFVFGAMIAFISAVLLAVDAHFGWGGLWGLTVPIFVFMAMNGFIVANSVAGALAAFPERAGAASALVGALQYGSGIFSTGLVGWLADGTAWPMGAIIGLAGTGCVVSAFLPANRHLAEADEREKTRSTLVQAHPIPCTCQPESKGIQEGCLSE